MGVSLAAGPSCTITELTRLGWGAYHLVSVVEKATPLLIAHLNTHGAVQVEVPRTHPGQHSDDVLVLLE
jgi:hypothetical protein